MRLQIAVFLFALFTLLSPSPVMAAESAAPPVTISEETTDEQLDIINRKASAYVDILNEFGTAQFVEAVDERIKMQEARKPSDKDWHFKVPTRGYGQRFTAALHANKELTPRMEPADTAMDQIAQTYPRLLSNIEELDQYYKRGDNRDDSGKKGQELGAALKADFQIFMSAHKVLQTSFNQIEDALKNATLARFEKAYGKKFFWYNSMLMRKAEVMLTLVPSDMKDFDPQVFETSFREFKGAVDAYEEYIKTAGSDLRKEASTRVNAKWLSGFISTCRSIMDYKKDNVPRGYANSVETLFTYYNNMVDDSNGIQFTMPPQ